MASSTENIFPGKNQDLRVRNALQGKFHLDNVPIFLLEKQPEAELQLPARRVPGDGTACPQGFPVPWGCHTSQQGWKAPQRGWSLLGDFLHLFTSEEAEPGEVMGMEHRGNSPCSPWCWTVPSLGVPGKAAQRDGSAAFLQQGWHQECHPHSPGNAGTQQQCPPHPLQGVVVAQAKTIPVFGGAGGAKIPGKGTAGASPGSCLFPAEARW